MQRADKLARIESLSAMFKGAKSVILNDFTGLNVEKMSELRKLCRENGVEYRVIKNRLAKRGIKDTPAEDLGRYFEGPTAVALSRGDEIVPAKVLAKFAEENEAPTFKAGIVEGKLIGAAEILALAKLPSREELLSKMLAGIKSPASGLVFVLQGMVRNLVCVLDAVRSKKTEGESAGKAPASD